MILTYHHYFLPLDVISLKVCLSSVGFSPFLQGKRSGKIILQIFFQRDIYSIRWIRQCFSRLPSSSEGHSSPSISLFLTVSYGYMNIGVFQYCFIKMSWESMICILPGNEALYWNYKICTSLYFIFVCNCLTYKVLILLPYFPYVLWFLHILM